jgi:hypothetical protein
MALSSTLLRLLRTCSFLGLRRAGLLKVSGESWIIVWWCQTAGGAWGIVGGDCPWAWIERCLFLGIDMACSHL